MEVRSIEPVYFAREAGTGYALIRIEDKPPRGMLVDFMRDCGVIRPGAVVPVCWEQLWDYRKRQTEIPSLFRWPQFTTWLDTWPDELAAFQGLWKRHFGLPGVDLADAAVVIWEEPRL